MNYSILENCNLFRGLSESEIRELIGTIPCYVKRFEENETVYHFMTKADRVGIILNGRVQAHKLYLNGNQVNLTVRGVGEIIGPVAVFSTAQCYPFEVVALESTEVLVCEKIGFLHLLNRDIRLMENLLTELASANFMLQQRLELLTYHAVQQKIAFYLLMASMQDGKTVVPIPDSVTRWAMMMNVSRPSLHRELRDMESQGLIRYAPPVIDILDEDGLKRILSQS